MMRKFLTLGLLGILPVVFYAQNTVVTDDESYEAHSSAMLDVYSLSKGLLVPRLTTTQRNNISSPAEGLLVYDTNEDKYYYYGSSTWNPIDAPSLWSENSDTIFITGAGKRYGVGTASPLAKLTVQGDATIAADEPLFEVKNSSGDVIFAVYENEVKVNFKETAKGVKGGFAVGGLSGTKAEPIEYMRITPDSVRIYIDDSGTKGVKGGFAVGGLSGTKAVGNKYFMINDDSARIYLKDPAKGVKGGFAVGGLSGTKGTKQKYLHIERDSARIYVDETVKGVKGGFAVGGLSGTKATNSFLDLTKDNYFIGHESGSSMTTGLYNAFLGYQAGKSNTEGGTNLFMGYQAGFSNTTGNENTFIGYQAGFLNEATQSNIYIGPYSGYSDGVSGPFTNYWNVFIGPYAGYSTEGVTSSVYVGYEAGRSTTVAAGNTFVGGQSGRDNTSGSGNAFFGFSSGIKMKNGSGNVFVGSSTGLNDTAGSYNTYVGANAGNQILKSTNNVLIGYYSGRNKTGGDDNVMVGQYTGASSSTAAQNVFVGSAAGENTTGNGNVFIGYNAGQNDDVSNQLIIGNSATSQLISGDFSTNKVDLAGNVEAGGDFYASSGNGVINCGGGIMDANVNVISDGTVNNAYATGDEDLYIFDDLEVDGAAYKPGGGSWLAQSDRRLKKDIRPYQDGLEQILKINPVYFKYNELSEKSTDKEYIGIVAQDVKDIIPYTVDLTPFKRKEIEDENGNVIDVKWDGKSYYTFDPSSLTYLLINAVKEQQKEIESLKNQSDEIEKLKNENKELRDLINQIQKKLE